MDGHLKYDFPVNLSDQTSSTTQLILLTDRNKKVLEIGPATGYVSKVLQERGCMVTAIELEPAAARLASRFCERMIVGDVEEVDFESTFREERFAVVMFGDVLEHLVDPRSVLERVRGVLEPGGCVVASVPNVAHASVRLSLMQGEFRYTELGLLDNTHLRFFTIETLTALFQDAGYNITTWRRIIAEPFGTELELREEDYPPYLVQSIRDDPEALTYQFVVKAYPNHARSNGRTPNAAPGRAASHILADLWRVDDQIRQKDEALAEKDAHLASQKELVLEHEEMLAQIEQELASIRMSAGYRVLAAYRRVIRFLFPPGSWRALPYRGFRRAVRSALNLRPPQPALARRVVKARQRYGTRRLVAKSMERLIGRETRILDPVQYALEVEWRDQTPPQVITRRPSRTGVPIINWVIPTLGEGGGHRTIFRFIDSLATQGFRQRVYEMPVGRVPRSSSKELKELIHKFYGLSAIDCSVSFERMEPADLVFATSWHTAYPIARFRDAGRKLYFVQDFEPLFAPIGTESVLAENSYRFGFHGVTAGPWLAEKLSSEFGMQCDYFNLAVDHSVYYPTKTTERNTIFFYARPATPRRGFELGVKALELFHRRNPGYRIVLAGGDLPGTKFPFPVTDVGYVNERVLNDYYNQSAAALVISLTNCSLLPLEIMASGCPVVTTAGDNNEKSLPADSAIFAVPSPGHLCDALEEAIKNPPSQERLTAATAKYSWEEETARVGLFLRRLMDEAD